jgi:hypothetical protein
MPERSRPDFPKETIIYIQTSDDRPKRILRHRCPAALIYPVASGVISPRSTQLAHLMQVTPARFASSIELTQQALKGSK